MACDKKKNKKNKSGIPKSRRTGDVFRTRTKGTYSTEIQGVLHPLVNGPEPYIVEKPIKVVSPQWGLIIDVSGFRKFRWNPCYHFVYKGVVNRPSAQMLPPIGAVTGNPGGYTPDVLKHIRENLPWPPPEVLDDCAAMAQEHFEETTPVDTELANFIFEILLVVWGIIKNLGKLVKLLKEIWENFTKEFQRLLKKGVSETDSHWLAWNFAVRPFIDDVQKLICSAERARKRLIWLQKNNGVPTEVKLRRRSVWDPGEVVQTIGPLGDYYEGMWNPLPGGVDPTANMIPAEYKIRYIDYNIDFTAQATILFQVPPYLLEFPPACDVVWQSQQGFFNPLAIAWEQLPFSWLLDWFLSYRTKLWTKIGDLSPIPDAEILVSRHAFKVTFGWEVYVENSITNEIEVIGVGRCSMYRRSPGLPEVEASPFRIPWKWYNASILFALLSQIGRSKKARRR